MQVPPSEFEHDPSGARRSARMGRKDRISRTIGGRSRRGQAVVAEKITACYPCKMRTRIAVLLVVPLLACARSPAPTSPAPLNAMEQQALLGVARDALQQYFRDGKRLKAPEL